jgi:MFS superfamily sulfate permease-like transporter
MLVPVGIAYAEASGVPGIYGLYATIVPLLAYALFGPSRILVLGPDSALAAVILAVVLPLSAGDPGRAVALAGAMAVVSGLVCIAVGVARLGFIPTAVETDRQVHERHSAHVALSRIPNFRIFYPGPRTI